MISGSCGRERAFPPLAHLCSSSHSWLVYDLTKDPFYLGLNLFLGQLPIMLFSLVGGVFADRLERKRLLLYSQYIQMVCAFALTLLFATPCGQGLAHSDPVFRGWRWAVLWRPRLFSAVADVGGT